MATEVCLPIEHVPACQVHNRIDVCVSLLFEVLEEIASVFVVNVDESWQSRHAIADERMRIVGGDAWGWLSEPVRQKTKHRLCLYSWAAIFSFSGTAVWVQSHVFELIFLRSVNDEVNDELVLIMGITA